MVGVSVATFVDNKPNLKGPGWTCWCMRSQTWLMRDDGQSSKFSFIPENHILLPWTIIMQDLVKSEHIMQSSHPRESQSYHKNEMKTIQVVEQILMLYCMTNQDTDTDILIETAARFYLEFHTMLC